MKLIYAIFLITLTIPRVGFSLSFLSTGKVKEDSQKNEISTPLLEKERRLIDIYKKNSPSVVNVSNIQVKRGFFFDAVEIPIGMGSGFVWDSEGHIVTNYHVADNATRYLISFNNDEKQYQAKFIGGEKNKDIAVLKLIEKPKVLHPIEIGKSASLQVGQMAIAIGNPFGLDHSMSAGIISALGRKIRGYGGIKIYDMIQTDAAINQGNSGGPLIDSLGRLIGMNTMIYSTSGTSAGLGFAVPVDTISRIVPQIIKHGKVIRPALGVAILPDAIKNRFTEQEGIIISEVFNNSSAEKAGLEGVKKDPSGRILLGDIIIGINQHKIATHDDIYNVLDNFKVGETVELHYVRKGKKQSAKIKLQGFDFDS
jgi:S1-C subfamily serine protease